MREIKFRVWQKSLKRFMSQYYDGGERIVMSLEGKPLEWDEMKNLREMSDDFVVQQYTGLKDMNGKDIYEGDYLWSTGSHAAAATAPGIVVFEEGRFFVSVWNIKKDIHSSKKFPLSSESDEVVGNIFEGVDK